MTFYLTTAIAYPNGTPHIGHAYEYVAADIIARFKRLDGEQVFFLTGTDEHGLKMQQTAQREGITCRELADRNAAKFKRLQDVLGSTYDRFIRTTDTDHYAASQELWRRMEAAGDIYLDSYSGWYSVRDEAYFAEDETEVRDGVRVAVSSGAEVTWTEEESYFFRLSRYAEPLLKLYEERPEFFGPEGRRNEIASFVRSGLNDLSISRTTFDWGVPVPGDEKHVMYVWVDALTNYLTGAGFPGEANSGDRFAQVWPPDAQIIGKDIARFHAVYWPAFLMSAGITLPERIHAHGFLFNEGEKMSKSVGNVVDPYDLIDAFELDALRFFLLREISYGQDGSYSQESIITRKNTDLANEYGNLAQRSLSMVAKNCGGQVPTPGSLTAEDEELLALARGVLPEARRHVDVQNLHLYVGACWKVLSEANRYFSAQEPWKLKKTDAARMETVLWVTLEVVRIITLLIQPVMPESTGKILDQLGVPAGEAAAAAGARNVHAANEGAPAITPVHVGGAAEGAGDPEAGRPEPARLFTAIHTPLAAGTPLPKPAPVFPKFQVEE